MLTLPIVCAGEYEDDKPIAVFARVQDAEEFVRRYNAERGHGIHDGARARVESIPAYPEGDPGRSGHNTAVRPDGGWGCSCGAGSPYTDEPTSREQMDAHLEHWAAETGQPAIEPR
ncbi:hypothetical protein [Micromonospora aurantiaca (nom. illeg.)]|uniref:hypothetical protein n=1 Tax=Micromonospora aurantiaca (nom. illeg.) TaxID=47850 RepID=UPI0011A20038|nr:hypothetical protein [Micromonospora aurantiaca]MBC9000543.1 hypothetical protein [Micromonospora aurantiaca]